MRTLIYALCQRGYGTQRLSRALTDIGLIGGHELIGCGWYGSITPVPQQLQFHFFNPGDFVIGPAIGGFTGDSKLVDAFFKWHRFRFCAVYPEEVEKLEAVLWQALLVYLQGEGYFVAIDCHLADWWPLVEKLASKHGFGTRCIVLAKDGRDYVQKLMWHKSCSLVSPHYGPRHVVETIYPPIMPGTEKMTRFEQVCHVWADMSAWFSKSGRTMVHVEDYNKKETHDLILNELYPEATEQQKERFSLYHEAYGSLGYRPKPKRLTGEWQFPQYGDWDAEQKDIFQSICGEMMDELGYSNREIPHY